MSQTNSAGTARSLRSWLTRHGHPFSYSPKPLERAPCENLPARGFTAGELIAMARAARSDRASA